MVSVDARAHLRHLHGLRARGGGAARAGPQPLVAPSPARRRELHRGGEPRVRHPRPHGRAHERRRAAGAFHAADWPDLREVALRGRAHRRDVAVLRRRTGRKDGPWPRSLSRIPRASSGVRRVRRWCPGARGRARGPAALALRLPMVLHLTVVESHILHKFEREHAGRARVIMHIAPSLGALAWALLGLPTAALFMAPRSSPEAPSCRSSRPSSRRPTSCASGPS